MQTHFYFEDLSYVLNGLFYQIYKQLGYGLREASYCQLLESLLKQKTINYVKESKIPLQLYGREITYRKIDFLIEDCIIIEIKASSLISQKHFYQVKEYLKLSGIKLGLLVHFNQKNVNIYRIINPNLNKP
ncbi:TPA: GxxExxY protein [Candidatus Falkowbacteria bacterium]|nr:GxxExxY protein [Candidatus Falkowbacteria bacterium]